VKIEIWGGVVGGIDLIEGIDAIGYLLRFIAGLEGEWELKNERLK